MYNSKQQQQQRYQQQQQQQTKNNSKHQTTNNNNKQQTTLTISNNYKQQTSTIYNTMPYKRQWSRKQQCHVRWCWAVCQIWLQEQESSYRLPSTKTIQPVIENLEIWLNKSIDTLAVTDACCAYGKDTYEYGRMRRVKDNPEKSYKRILSFGVQAATKLLNK